MSGAFDGLPRGAFQRHTSARQSGMHPSLSRQPSIPSLRLPRDADRLLRIDLGVTDSTPFPELASLFQEYVREQVDKPYTHQQLRTLAALSQLGYALATSCNNPGIVAALLWCRQEFVNNTHEEEKYGLNASRALACEIIASDSLNCLHEVDLIHYLCYEIPLDDDDEASRAGDSDSENEQAMESSGLLGYAQVGTGLFSGGESAPRYVGLNALEIAVVAEAKYFLSMRPVQSIVDGIWSGRIVFWESLIVTGSKRPHVYNPRKADPFCRLRVPRYQKAFEALFSVILLALYYGVLVERNPSRLTATEVALLAFFIAFAYDEFSQWQDAGTLFYTADIWSWLDLGIIVLFSAHLICRVVGLVKKSDEIIDNSFDILALAALVLVPRMCSLLSLHPYFGVLIPCLKRMGQDFTKFLVIITILYVGFLSTFSILGRDKFTLSQMSNLMLRVFFGATGVGFDAMKDISPILGPPLMIIFVVLTNIVLITSVISLLSNSLTTMLNNANEEYLFMYSTFVLESVTSNRLTHFYPPMNLIPLFLLRPLRLFLSSERLRRLRIFMLKLTHFPIVAAIIAFERVGSKNNDRRMRGPAISSSLTPSIRSLRKKRIDRLGAAVNRSAGASTHVHDENDERRQALADVTNENRLELQRMKEAVDILSVKLDTLLAAA